MEAPLIISVMGSNFLILLTRLGPKLNYEEVRDFCHARGLRALYEGIHQRAFSLGLWLHGVRVGVPSETVWGAWLVTRVQDAENRVW